MKPIVLTLVIVLQAVGGSLRKQVDEMEKDVASIKTSLGEVIEEVHTLSTRVTNMEATAADRQESTTKTRSLSAGGGRGASVANLGMDNNAKLPGKVEKMTSGKCYFKGEGLTIHVTPSPDKLINVFVSFHELGSFETGYTGGMVSLFSTKTELPEVVTPDKAILPLVWPFYHFDGRIPVTVVEEMRKHPKKECEILFQFIAANPPAGYSNSITWLGEFFANHKHDVENEIKILYHQQKVREQLIEERKKRIEEEERRKFSQMRN
ncbi:hypothetical protein FOL47_005269 [Perkinsus chesapeaki]|uniref:Uncharacterized protein n=1 Tax=Perkinsus chesapeaki TaxID=330153 RepID=A0A7J6LY32_PERCH|nr:hypothetical protein FOL47_005269 [Perkinsus chesapeaki]